MSVRAVAVVVYMCLVAAGVASAQSIDGSGGPTLGGLTDALSAGLGDQRKRAKSASSSDKSAAAIDLQSVSSEPLLGLGDDDAMVGPEIYVPAQRDGVIVSKTAEPEMPGAVPAQAVPSQSCDDADGDGVCDDRDHCSETPPGAIVLPHGCHLTLQAPLELVGVFFDFNGYRLRPESYEILDRVVAVLKQRPSVIAEVAGHADAAGNKAVNQKISTRRAKAVYSYLVDRGIAPYRLSYRGYGSSLPVADNATANRRDDPRGRARNRRVELRVTGSLAQAQP